MNIAWCPQHRGVMRISFFSPPPTHFKDPCPRCQQSLVEQVRTKYEPTPFFNVITSSTNQSTTFQNGTSNPATFTIFTCRQTPDCPCAKCTWEAERGD